MDGPEKNIIQKLLQEWHSVFSMEMTNVVTFGQTSARVRLLRVEIENETSQRNF